MGVSSGIGSDPATVTPGKAAPAAGSEAAGKRVKHALAVFGGTPAQAAKLASLCNTDEATVLAVMAAEAAAETAAAEAEAAKAVAAAAQQQPQEDWASAAATAAAEVIAAWVENHQAQASSKATGN